MKLARRHFVALLGSLTASIATTSLAVKPTDLVEPVHRVANVPKVNPIQNAGSPLDRALDIARHGLQKCRTSVSDYTATLVHARERQRDAWPLSVRRCESPQPESREW